MPRLVTAVKQTTIMRDNITAYSTAVGPSSLFKKRFIFMAKLFIFLPSDRYLGLTEVNNKTLTLRILPEFIAMISEVSGGNKKLS